jgi:alcohol dehydrogenase
LENFMERLGISCNPAAYGIERAEWRSLVEDSLKGERGQNFLGSKERLIEASQAVRLAVAKSA